MPKGRVIGERSRIALRLLRDSGFQLTREELIAELGRDIPPGVAHRAATDRRAKARAHHAKKWSISGRTYGPRRVSDEDTIRWGRKIICRSTIHSLLLAGRVVLTPELRFAPGPRWDESAIADVILPPYDEAPS